MVNLRPEKLQKEIHSCRGLDQIPAGGATVHWAGLWDYPLNFACQPSCGQRSSRGVIKIFGDR